jgi:hypothetical protein
MFTPRGNRGEKDQGIFPNCSQTVENPRKEKSYVSGEIKINKDQ